MNELDQIILEATTSVERELLAEDKGWIRLGGLTQDVLDASARITAVQQSRVYCARDPLACQALRLWTDYSFGTGMNWDAKDGTAKAALQTFWDYPLNASVLAPKGQRKCSNKLLTDGEIFFAIFLGKPPTIRSVDPLEVVEIITDPDDKENPRFYRRSWTDAQGKLHDGYYKSWLNPKGVTVKSISGTEIKASEDAIFYHVVFNSIGQRGVPLIYPALDWIPQYRRFLASRIAIMLALARFAWKNKVKGGAAAVAAIKAATDDKTPAAASTLVENEAVDTQQIRTDSGANQAKEDGRMVKLQICSAVGIPEQYFGDISTGNLATAKTVELPMLKMFQGYQQLWRDVYKDLNNIVLDYASIDAKKRYVDIDFPAVAPEDAISVAQALSQIVTAFPALANSHDVIQQALLSIGVNDPDEVIGSLGEESKNVEAQLIKVLKQFKEVIKRDR